MLQVVKVAMTLNVKLVLPLKLLLESLGLFHELGTDALEGPQSLFRALQLLLSFANLRLEVALVDFQLLALLPGVLDVLPSRLDELSGAPLDEGLFAGPV